MWSVAEYFLPRCKKIVESRRIQVNSVNESRFRLCSLSKAFDFDQSHDSDEDSLAGDGENDEVEIVEEVDNGTIKVAGHTSCDDDENVEDDGSGDDYWTSAAIVGILFKGKQLFNLQKNETFIITVFFS